MRPTEESWAIVEELNTLKDDGADNRRPLPHRWLSAMTQATGTPRDVPCTKCYEKNQSGQVMDWGKECVKVDIDGLLRCSNCEWHGHQGCKMAQSGTDDAM